MNRFFAVLLIVFFACLNHFSYAAPFSIVPNDNYTLPTRVIFGSTTSAVYTVTNNVNRTLTGNYLQAPLPANIVQAFILPSKIHGKVPGFQVCGYPFTLAATGEADDHCALVLTISGAVSGYAPRICASDGLTCVNVPSQYQLNVNSVTLVSIAVSCADVSIAVGATTQCIATATYSDSSTADITSSATWTSDNAAASVDSLGSATGSSPGVANIIAADHDNIIHGSTPLTVTAPPLYAYVPDGGSTPSPAVQRCVVNVSTGLFTDPCTPIRLSGISTWDPRGIAFATQGATNTQRTTYSYVASSGSLGSSAGVFVCNDALAGCIDAISGPTWVTPNGIVFATVGFPATQYAYVPDVGSTNIYQCAMNGNGTFSGCAPRAPSSGVSWQTPSALVFVEGATQYAYVTDFAGAVLKCTLMNSGAFDTCTTQSNSWSHPHGIAFAAVGAGTQYIYVADQGRTKVYQCPLDGNGDFTTCAATTGWSGGAATPAWTPTGISFKTIVSSSKLHGPVPIQYAYVSDAGGFVWQCTLDTNGGAHNGLFTSCQKTNNPTSWQVNGNVTFSS